MSRLDEIRKQYGEWEEDPSAATPAVPANENIDRIRGKYNGAWKETAKDLVPEPAAAAKPAPPKPVTKEDFKGSTLELGFPPLTGVWDTGIPIPARTAQRNAQRGAGFADLIQGVKQAVGGDGAPTVADVDEKRRIDAPLTSTLGGKVAKFSGKTAPWLAVPGGFARGLAGDVAGPLIENMVIGGLQGAAEPVGTGESRTKNAITSAAASGALSIAPAAARSNLANLPEERRALIDDARSRGIPLSFADATDSGTVKTVRSILDDSVLPGLSSKGQRAAKQNELNRNVGEAWGVDRASHTPAELAADKSRIGQDIENAWRQHDIPWYGGYNGLEANLARRRADAAEFGTAPGTVGNAVDVNIRRGIEDQLVPGAGNPNSPVLPGSNAFAAQKNWRKKYEGSMDETAQAMMGARQNVIDAYREQLNPAERGAFDQLRNNFRAASTLNDVMEKNAVGRAGRDLGDIRSTDLSAAVQKAYGDRASPFGELPRIGENFLTDRVIKTGGSQRALLQNAGVLGAASGAGWFGGAASLPYLLGGYGAALGTAKAINSPAALEFLLNNPYRAGVPFTEKMLASLPNRVAGQGALSALNYFGPTDSNREREEERQGE